MTSATYRQSSKLTAELRERDPRNRLLARAPQMRLEAEMVRDQAMALSGLLSRKLGGPSVFPPQPDGLWQAAFNGQRTWATSQGADRYRRGLYTFWRRTVPYPSMAAFDAPSREICAIKRVRTNTPLQAFVTLNDPVYVEAAQALARRIVREGGSDVRAACDMAWSSAFAGRPSPSRSSRSSLFSMRNIERFRTDPQAAASLGRASARRPSRGNEPGRAGRVDDGCQRALESGRGLDQRLIPMDMELPLNLQLARAHSRRQFLKTSQAGLGAIALASLLLEREGQRRAATSVGAKPKGRGAGRARLSTASALSPMALKPPHFAPKAKRVVYLHMSGGPPQQDLFDFKPELVKHHMKPCPDELLKNQRFAFIKGHPKLLGTPYKFQKSGQCGAMVSELLPHLRGSVDEIAIVKSMYTDQFNHAPAELFLYTGSSRNGGAAMGSWITYGLGTENQDLPGFIVLISGGTDPTGGKALWSTGFLPSVYQGVQCRTVGDPVLYVNDPKGMDRSDRRRTLDALRKLNEYELSEFGDPETLTRISQYELAFRMQMAVPDVMDIRQEPPRILEEYGANPGASSFANNCLLARRLLERGVRYVQLFDWGWDCHGTGAGDDIVKHLPEKCKEVDRPIAALLADLKRRGLLEDTLVVWGGEFGRTSMNEARGGSTFLGRDHHPHCFTIWLAGGGHQAGHHRRRHRSAGIQHHRKPGEHPRPAGHDPSPAGPRRLEAHLRLPGSPPEAHRPRRRGQDPQGAAGLKPTARPTTEKCARLICSNDGGWNT